MQVEIQELAERIYDMKECESYAKPFEIDR